MGQIDVFTITLTTRSMDVLAGDMFCWPTAHFSCQGFLSKANLSLQKAGLRAGSRLQNLLSWPALAPLTPVAYMQELSEFRTCCRGSPEVSFPTLSAIHSLLHRKLAAIPEESLGMGAIPQLMLSNRTGESVPLHCVGTL